ncbi:hypothetical protein R3P38DRAFT_3219579 [Favolaschia claudopus]|uniref:Uncharacterized protein n=1 Tax=Favolaschia claudopus TaxID=2862362 RepID=A0AAW0A299_9AGAR
MVIPVLSDISLDDEPVASLPRISIDIKPVLNNIINLCDSDLDAEVSSGRFFKAKKINISRTQKVDHDEWAKKATKVGRSKGLDAILKEEENLWGKGTNGSTTHNTNCQILGNIPTCRSTHRCNGAYKCEFFDGSLLECYEHTDAEDMSLMRKIFDLQLIQNQMDAGSAAGKAAL